jgi:hypothetical protein
VASFSDDFEADLADPALRKDIELSKDTLAFLEGRATTCFLCRWMLEDYKKNGTFTGVTQKGEIQSYEIFPIRGEVNHLWLELYQKPYPFKKKVIAEEAQPTFGPPSFAPVPQVTLPAPVPPAQPAPVAQPAPEAPPVAPSAPPAGPVVSKPVRR